MTFIPRLSVIISALNEEKSVAAVVSRVVDVLRKNVIQGEVVFLNNHSTDNTGIIAEEMARNHPEIRVIQRYNRPSRDLGSSLKEGIAAARGEYFLIMDCDLSHNPKDIPLLFKHCNGADIIVGSRYISGGNAELHWKRRILSRLYNFMARSFTGVPVFDLTTGFKLYRKEAVRHIRDLSDGFGLHVELPVKAHFAGARFLEIPIHYGKSPKESTLRYRRQFWSYMKPVLWGFRERLRRLFFSSSRQ